MPKKVEISEEENKLNLKSDEIRDIMSKSPMWVVKWGISTVFIIILLGILISWFMKYPDILKGEVSVTHVNPPVKVVSQSSGNLISLYIEEGELVKEGTLLAEIENPLSAGSVEQLKLYTEKLERGLTTGSSNLPLMDRHPGNLGELQSVMNALEMDIRSYNLRGTFKIDQRSLQTLNSQLANEEKLAAISNQVLKLAEEDFANAKLKFDSEASLYESGVIAQSDYIQAQSLFNQKQMQYEQAKLSAVQSQINLSTLQSKIDQLRYNKATNEKMGYGDILAHLETIRSYIYGWRQKYILVAPVSGKVSYMTHLRKGIHIKNDQELFAIIQADDVYVAHGYIPAIGAGKLRVGQDVSVLLDNYPYHEYGMVLGKVKYVADIPTNNAYRVEISMPYGLLSTHGDTLKSSPEMLGSIEVVTEVKRVLQRIMQSILKIFESR